MPHPLDDPPLGVIFREARTHSAWLPMSGFDNAKVDAAFFPDGRYRSNFLLNLGYGDPSKLHPRLLRLEFDEARRIE